MDPTTTPHPRPWYLRWPFWLAGVAAVALLVWFSRGRADRARVAAPAATPVFVEPVRVQDLPETLDQIGSAQPWLGATIRAQIAGRLVAVPVKEGAIVQQGQLLAELDAAPYQAAVAQAAGVLERDRAVLQNARLTSARYDKLLAGGMIDRATVDTQAAAVRQSESQIRVDDAALQAARVNLGYTRIVAPFTGRLGLRFADPGNLVGPNDANGILVLNQISPMAVVFAVPQGAFQRIVAASKRFSVPLPVQALSQETGALLATGQLSIADNRVDAGTGTVQLKARFDNADQQLWPGQMLNVRMQLGLERNALTVPSQAVANGPDGAFVYVVRGGKALLTPVRVKMSFNGVSAIEGALASGEPVVVDGQLNLRPGAAVEVRDTGKRPPA